MSYNTSCWDETRIFIVICFDRRLTALKGSAAVTAIPSSVRSIEFGSREGMAGQRKHMWSALETLIALPRVSDQ